MKRIILLFIGLFIFSISLNAQNRQHLIYENTFENPGALEAWPGHERANKSSISISDSVAHSGHYSLKFELKKNDLAVANGKRAEVALKPEPRVKVERWVGFSVYLPESFSADPEPEIIQQWHDIPDLSEGGVWRSPPFALYTQSGHWFLSVKSSARRLTSNKDLIGKEYDLGAYTNSKWTDWVFHIRFSWDNDGLIEVWQNGNLVQTLNGPNAYNDNVGNYFKLGIYKWVWMPEKDKGKSTTTSREIFYDDVRIGDEGATYKDVAP